MIFKCLDFFIFAIERINFNFYKLSCSSTQSSALMDVYYELWVYLLNDPFISETARYLHKSGLLSSLICN
jgi:hypothetical protein